MSHPANLFEGGIQQGDMWTGFAQYLGRKKSNDPVSMRIKGQYYHLRIDRNMHLHERISARCHGSVHFDG